MEDRIADEIRDTGIASNIRDAIRTAIKEYQHQRFFFNEDRTLVFTTSSSQEFYTTLASPPAGVDMGSLLFIDSVKVNISGSRLPLVRRDWKTLERWSVTTSNLGTPYDYGYYQQQMRLYPIPNASLTVQIAAVVRFATVSATTDTNAWFTEGELMIRNAAKAHIYSHVKGDDEQAAKFVAFAEREATRLRTETGRRLSSNRVRPWSL